MRVLLLVLLAVVAAGASGSDGGAAARNGSTSDPVRRRWASRLRASSEGLAPSHARDVAITPSLRRLWRTLVRGRRRSVFAGTPDEAGVNEFELDKRLVDGRHRDDHSLPGDFGTNVTHSKSTAVQGGRNLQGAFGSCMSGVATPTGGSISCNPAGSLPQTCTLSCSAGYWGVGSFSCSDRTCYGSCGDNNYDCSYSYSTQVSSACNPYYVTVYSQASQQLSSLYYFSSSYSCSSPYTCYSKGSTDCSYTYPSSYPCTKYYTTTSLQSYTYGYSAYCSFCASSTSSGCTYARQTCTKYATSQYTAYGSASTTSTCSNTVYVPCTSYYSIADTCYSPATCYRQTTGTSYSVGYSQVASPSLRYQTCYSTQTTPVSQTCCACAKSGAPAGCPTSSCSGGSCGSCGTFSYTAATCPSSCSVTRTPASPVLTCTPCVAPALPPAAVLTSTSTASVGAPPSAVTHACINGYYSSGGSSSRSCSASTGAWSGSPLLCTPCVLPAVPASVAAAVTVYAADGSGSPYTATFSCTSEFIPASTTRTCSTADGSWSGALPVCILPSPTVTVTASATATRTMTATSSGTTSPTASESATGTPSGTTSPTASKSATGAPSGTTSPTASESATGAPSGTASPTASEWATGTPSGSTSPTASEWATGASITTRSHSPGAAATSSVVTAFGSSAAMSTGNALASPLVTNSVGLEPASPPSTITRSPVASPPSNVGSASTSSSSSIAPSIVRASLPPMIPALPPSVAASSSASGPSTVAVGSTAALASHSPAAFALSAVLQQPCLASSSPQVALVAAGLPPPVVHLEARVGAAGELPSDGLSAACGLQLAHADPALVPEGFPPCPSLEHLLPSGSLRPEVIGAGQWRLRLATMSVATTAAASASSVGCSAVLRCNVTGGAGASVPIVDVPLLVLTTAAPLLHDVVMDGLSRDGTLALKSQRQTSWMSASSLLPHAASVCVTSSCAAAEAVVASAAWAAAVQAPGADAPRALSLVLAGRTNATLIAAVDGLFPPDGTPRAEAWAVSYTPASLSGPAVRRAARLQVRPITAASSAAALSMDVSASAAAALVAGRLARITLPAKEEVCGSTKSAASAGCTVSLLLLPLPLPSRPWATVSDLAVIGSAGGGGGASSLFLPEETAAFAAVAASSGAGAAVAYPPAPLQGVSSGSIVGIDLAFTPVYVPINTSDPLAALQAGAQAVLGGSDFCPPSAEAPATFFLTPGGAVSTRSAFGLSGIRFAESCDAVDAYSESSSPGVCSNASSPLRAACTWGEGGDCIPCPSAAALCPGGRALVPLPGWWVPSPLGSAPSELVRCPPPATSRCPGGVNPLTGATACGVGYAPGSYACSVCSAGWYPVSRVGMPATGACARCPAVTAWDAATASLTVAGYTLAALTPLAALVVYIHSRHGGSLGAGAGRALRFVFLTVLGLQALVQSSPPASDALPAATASFFEALQTLQFKAPVPHPACTPGVVPLSADMLSLALPLALACALPALVAATWKWSLPPHASPGRGNSQSVSLAARVLGYLSCAGRFGARAAPLSKHRATSARLQPVALASGAVSAARRALPVATRLVAIAAFLLYGRTLSTAYALLRCQPVVLSVGAYVALPSADGTALQDASPALAATLPPGGFSALRHCAIASMAGNPACVGALAVSEVQLSVQVLASDPYTLCGEGPHPAAAALAVAAIVLFGIAMPLGYYGFYKLRVARAAAAAGPVTASEASKPVPVQRQCFTTLLPAFWRRDRVVRSVPLRPQALERDPATLFASGVGSGGQELAFFLRGAHKPQRPAAQLVDLAVLHCAVLSARFFSPAASAADARSGLALALAPLLAGMVYTAVARPFRSTVHFGLSLAIDALTCLAYFLTYASSLHRLDVAAGGGDTAATAEAVNGLGYAVLVGAAVVFAGAFAGFTVVLRQGAQQEQQQQQEQVQVPDASVRLSASLAVARRRSAEYSTVTHKLQHNPLLHQAKDGETKPWQHGARWALAAVAAAAEASENSPRDTARPSASVSKQHRRREFGQQLAPIASRPSSASTTRWHHAESKPAPKALPAALPGAHLY